MKLKLDHYNPHRQSMVVMGKTQTHKTSISKVITKLIVDSGRKVIVYDPNLRWTQKRDHEIAFSPIHVVRNIHEINLKRNLCIYQPLEDSEENFEAFCKKMVSLFPTGFFTVIMDELHNNVTTFSAAKAFKKLTKNCHNYDVGYIAIMQRFQEVVKSVVSNTDHMIVFKLKNPGDMKPMKQMMGDEAERLFFSGENPLPQGSGLYQNADGKITEFET